MLGSFNTTTINITLLGWPLWLAQKGEESAVNLYFRITQSQGRVAGWHLVWHPPVGHSSSQPGLNPLPASLPHPAPLPGSHTDCKLFQVWDLPRPLLKAECVTAGIHSQTLCFFYRKMSLHCPDLSSAQGSSSRTATVTAHRDSFTQDLPAGSQARNISLPWGPSSHSLAWGRAALHGYGSSWTRKEKSHMRKGPSRKSSRFQSACISFLEAIYYLISVLHIPSD